MCTTKLFYRPVLYTFPVAIALPDFKVCLAASQRVCRFGALMLVLLFSAPLAAALLDSTAAHPRPPVASPGPTPLIHVAQATTENSSIPAAILPKLDAQIVLGLKKSRGEPPYDKGAAPEPDIPIKEGSSVLVDIDANISEALLQDIKNAGGQLAPSPDPAHIVRAMLPLAEVEALARRADVNFVAPAHLTFQSKPLMPAPPNGAPGTKR